LLTSCASEEADTFSIVTYTSLVNIVLESKTIVLDLGIVAVPLG
jgi:hypothetical protein